LLNCNSVRPRLLYEKENRRTEKRIKGKAREEEKKRE